MAAQAACPVDIAERTSVTGFTRSGYSTQGRRTEIGADKFHPNPQISGKNGGQKPDCIQFRRDGVILLGTRARSHEDNSSLHYLKETLAAVDQFQMTH